MNINKSSQAKLLLVNEKLYAKYRFKGQHSCLLDTYIVSAVLNKAMFSIHYSVRNSYELASALFHWFALLYTVMCA